METKDSERSGRGWCDSCRGYGDLALPCSHHFAINSMPPEPYKRYTLDTPPADDAPDGRARFATVDEIALALSQGIALLLFVGSAESVRDARPVLLERFLASWVGLFIAIAGELEDLSSDASVESLAWCDDGPRSLYPTESVRDELRAAYYDEPPEWHALQVVDRAYFDGVGERVRAFFAARGLDLDPREPLRPWVQRSTLAAAISYAADLK